MRPFGREDRISCITSLQGETGDAATKYVAWESGAIEKIKVLRDGSLTSKWLQPLAFGASLRSDFGTPVQVPTHGERILQVWG
jgi:hypothetical protein